MSTDAVSTKDAAAYTPPISTVATDKAVAGAAKAAQQVDGS